MPRDRIKVILGHNLRVHKGIIVISTENVQSKIEFQYLNSVMGSHKLRVKIKQAYAHIQLPLNPKNDKSS